MGSDDESASDDESRRTAGHALDSVPVEIEGPDVAKLRCKLCCAKATENSPLALSTDMSPALMEWRLYSKIKSGEKSYQECRAADSAIGVLRRFLHWDGKMNILRLVPTPRLLLRLIKKSIKGF